MKIFVAIVLVDVMTSCLFADPLHVQSGRNLKIGNTRIRYQSCFKFGL